MNIGNHAKNLPVKGKEEIGQKQEFCMRLIFPFLLFFVFKLLETFLIGEN